MNVGQLKQLLEHVNDETKIYAETMVAGVFAAATISLDFVVESQEFGELNREMADPEVHGIDNEIALVIW